MCSRFRDVALFSACLAVASACRTNVSSRESPPQRRVLRICADPNNLPFSNQAGEGFENRIAELVARDLDARLEYTWFAQRRGFIRNTLGARLCDVVMGVPGNFEPVETTRPYYRSTYVFVTREARNLRISSIDDPALKHLSIGVHVIGDDYANPPPVYALGRRSIVRNISGYSIYGDYSQPNPPARLIEAVAAGEIDVAIVWGPFGGYFGQRQLVPLKIVPVSPEIDLPDIPFVFYIAIGVRKGESALREEIEEVLDRREGEIQQILAEYGVPLKPLAHQAAMPAER